VGDVGATLVVALEGGDSHQKGGGVAEVVMQTLTGYPLDTFPQV